MTRLSQDQMWQALQYQMDQCGDGFICLPPGLDNWLNGQISQMIQMWQTADWRMAASIGYGMIMAGAVGALAASGVGIPLVILAGVGMVAANTMFNAMLYDDGNNFGANLTGGGVEGAFGIGGGMIGGPAGWVVGSVIGAGLGQITTNALSGRPWDEGVLANVVFSGVSEGVGGAIGHGLGKKFFTDDLPIGRLEDLHSRQTFWDSQGLLGE